MLKSRSVIILTVLSLVLNTVSVAACGATQKRATPNAKQQASSRKSATPADNTTASRGGEKIVDGDVKVLSEGGFSRVGDALLIVARNPETYSALRSDLANNLPELNADFFKSNAVIAAFLGTRRTGGYSVNFTRDKGGVVRVTTVSPQAGELSAQVISAPFKIASVPLGNDEKLKLEADDAWKTRMRPYHVTSGILTVSGGIAGRSEQFNLGGDLRVMRYGKFATIAFALKNTNGTKTRILNNILSGIVSGNRSLLLAPLDAGSFIEGPTGELSVTGTFTADENNLALAFAPLPSHVSDGYAGQGTLKAVASAPPLPKAKPSLIDEEM